jgi:YcxB-like protein
VADLLPLTFVFELPREEQVRASRYVSNRQWGTWLGYAAFGGAGLFLIAHTALCVTRGGVVNWPSTMLAAGGSLAMVGFIYFLPNYVVWQMRRALPIHQGPHKWTINPGVGFATESPSATASYEWKLIRKVVESDEFFLFYLVPTFAVVLPKRVVGAAAEGLRTLLRADLGDRAKVRP